MNRSGTTAGRGLGGVLRQAVRAVLDGEERWRLRQRLRHAADKVRCGFYRLPTHRELLRRPWNVLLILDACRADTFRDLEPAAAAVRSLGRDTREWTERFMSCVLPRCGMPEVLWFTANPVVDSALGDMNARGVRTVRLWETAWELIGPERIPSVHPGRVNAAVEEYLALYGQPERMLVQYLQPHSPYIGDIPLALTQWGELPDRLSRLASKMRTPMQAVREGILGWDQVRAAYRANLRLVLEHARQLAGALKGRVIITADHGELLGEDGRFGHDPSFHHKELYLVPWLESDNGAFEPAAVAEEGEGRGDAATLEARLRSLGYI